MTTRDISELYAEYEIPSWLGLHMRRVAAVAVTVFDAIQDARAADGGAGSLLILPELVQSRADLITACLLHDMGNVIKFDFAAPIFPEDQESHWKEVQQKMIARYGRDEHSATIAILNEIGVSPRVREIVDTINFMRCEEIERSADLLVQITQYADTRVIPSGVASLADRMADMYIRYAHKYPKNDEATARRVRALETMECNLFTNLPIVPSDITESSVAALRDSFEHFPIAIAEIRQVE